MKNISSKHAKIKMQNEKKYLRRNKSHKKKFYTLDNKTKTNKKQKTENDKTLLATAP